MATLQGCLPNKSATAGLQTQRKADSCSVADLTGLKYDIESHLDPEIIRMCRKEGFKLMTSSSTDEAGIEGN